LIVVAQCWFGSVVPALAVAGINAATSSAATIEIRFMAPP
jgi:hypothetical protein